MAVKYENLVINLSGVSSDLDGAYYYEGTFGNLYKYLRSTDSNEQSIYIRFDEGDTSFDVYRDYMTHSFSASFDNIENFNLSNVEVIDTANLTNVNPKVTCLVMDETTPAQIKIDELENGASVNTYACRGTDITGNFSTPPPPTVTLKSAGTDEPETEGSEFPETITVSNSGRWIDSIYPKINRIYNGKPIYAISKVVDPNEGLPAVAAFIYNNNTWELILFNPMEYGSTIDDVILNVDDSTLEGRISNTTYRTIYYRYSDSDNKWVKVDKSTWSESRRSNFL